MVEINALKDTLKLYIPYNILNRLPLIGISIGGSMVITLIVLIFYKIYIRNRDRFKSYIEINRMIVESRDSITKWIESTERRIVKNNLKIKTKRFLIIGIVFFVVAFIFSMNVFKNITAAILFSAIFLVIPEYLFSLYEDSIERKIEDQLVSTLKIYIAEFIQRKPIQKIFFTISTKVNDPVGKYFGDSYYELITGSSIDIVLSKLTSKFSSSYGKMFIQLIHQSQKDGSVISLFSELTTKVETHIELSRSNKTNIAGDRLQAFIISLLPIPAYFVMARFFPETKFFIRETYYGRIIITLSFLSIFVFIILDRFIRRVE